MARDELLARYRTYLRGARVVVDEVTEHARGHRTALLCYEAEPEHCHRSLLAPRVGRRLGVMPRDL